MITITSKVEGFRRCGIAHPATPTRHNDNAFTKEQLEILKAESMLIVVIDKSQAKAKPEASE